jgi:hypothetical protein
MPEGDEWSCGYYFCEQHLFFGGPSQLCEPCVDAWFAAHPEVA